MSKEKCFHCQDKWNCYQRQMLGATNKNCTIEEKKQNIKDWKWFELYGETPQDRQLARARYIDICKACWNKQLA